MSSIRPTGEFSEETFYLRQFRHRTIGIAVDAGLLKDPTDLLFVADKLRANDTRTVVFTTDAAVATALDAPLVSDRTRFEAATWRALRSDARAVFVSTDLFRACLELAPRLRIPKLVLIEAGHRRSQVDGSFIDRETLARYLDDAGPALDPQTTRMLETVRALIDKGVPAVNTCLLSGLHEELFTYAGSGTLFTNQRYIEVHPFGIEDYDAAENLIRRGMEEGFLAPRNSDQMDALLQHGFGAYVDGHHLAGMGALHPVADMAELAGLYALTRFSGEGVGPSLVEFAIDAARQRGYRRVFACTTSGRVGRFFERLGFQEVDREVLPAAKWQGYDAERLPMVRCFVRTPAP